MKIKIKYRSQYLPIPSSGVFLTRENLLTDFPIPGTESEMCEIGLNPKGEQSDRALLHSSTTPTVNGPYRCRTPFRVPGRDVFHHQICCK